VDQRPNKILICVNRRFKADEASCAARGGFAIAEAVERGVLDRRIDIEVERFICLGQCNKGPTIKLVPGNFILGADLDMVDHLLGKLEAVCGTREAEDEDTAPPAHLLGS